jgi:betaine reductase
MKRIVHYINQFFGGIGGEDKAGVSPSVTEGPVGPGRAFQAAVAAWGEIVATVICGDNYFAEDIERAAAEVEKLVLPFRPDIVIAGPAFNAGRYGMACAAVCKRIREQLGIPVVTGMYQENPGVDLCRRDAYVIETTNSARGMGKAVPVIAEIARKLLVGQKIGTPAAEGYFPRGLLINEVQEKTGAERVVDLLLSKLRGEPYESEVPRAAYDTVKPAPPVREMRNAKIALVTDGGLVPKGNPDRIESLAATRFGAYDITDVETLSPENYDVNHGGYDSVFIKQDPNRLVPVDVLRELEKEGSIGKLHDKFYSTTGVACHVEVMKKLAEKMGQELVSDRVSGVILTST